ncbi:MAG TPA: hypothetical protein DCL54_10100, partial [Alphaproteobacteria bacterium]|nr:hypothetical protein [Alphaproteobacteria bacterium]
MIDIVQVSELAQSLSQVFAGLSDLGSQVQQAVPIDPAPAAAPLDAIETAPAGTSAPPNKHDLSIIGLIEKADWVVKGVMGLLAVLSVWSWAIIFDKWTKLGRAHKEADRFEHAFWSGRSLD